MLSKCDLKPFSYVLCSTLRVTLGCLLRTRRVTCGASRGFCFKKPREDLEALKKTPRRSSVRPEPRVTSRSNNRSIFFRFKHAETRPYWALDPTYRCQRSSPSTQTPKRKPAIHRSDPTNIDHSQPPWSHFKSHFAHRECSVSPPQPPDMLRIPQKHHPGHQPTQVSP